MISDRLDTCRRTHPASCAAVCANLHLQFENAAIVCSLIASTDFDLGPNVRLTFGWRVLDHPIGIFLAHAGQTTRRAQSRVHQVIASLQAYLVRTINFLR